MSGSDATATGRFRSSPSRRFAAVAAAFGASLALASALTPAEAQWWLPPWANPYFRGDYPPPPDERDGYSAPSGVSVVEVRRHVAKLGLHLVAKPRRKDEIYLAEASDPNGTLHRLVFDAESGRLIENTPLPPRKKKVAAEKPASASASAPAAAPTHAPDEAAGH